MRSRNSKVVRLHQKASGSIIGDLAAEVWSARERTRLQGRGAFGYIRVFAGPVRESSRRFRAQGGERAVPFARQPADYPVRPPQKWRRVSPLATSALAVRSAPSIEGPVPID